MTYFEARRARAQRNHESLYNLAKDIIAIEPEMEVYVNRNDTVHEAMVFIHGETVNRVLFLEVPFRWDDPIPENGYLYNNQMPYTPRDIIENMEPIDYHKGHINEPIRYTDKESFLKWQSYLVPINLDNI